MLIYLYDKITIALPYRINAMNTFFLDISTFIGNINI